MERQYQIRNSPKFFSTFVGHTDLMKWQIKESTKRHHWCLTARLGAAEQQHLVTDRLMEFASSNTAFMDNNNNHFCNYHWTGCLLSQWSGNLSRVYRTFTLAGRVSRPHCNPCFRLSDDRKWMDSSHYAWTWVDERKWATADSDCTRSFVSTHQYEGWTAWMQPTVHFRSLSCVDENKCTC